MSAYLYGDGVDSVGFIRLLENFGKDRAKPHALRFYRDGKLLLSADFPPYRKDDAMQVYSLSKAFTSAAIGICVKDGLLSLDEKIADIFREDLPEEPSERLLKVTVQNLLTMQSGHGGCCMRELLSSRHAVKAFLKHDFAYEPGTQFAYSTACTLMLGAIVTAKTGKPLDAFIHERLFAPMGFGKPDWAKSPDGLCLAGVGLFITPDQALEYGKLLLEGGRGILTPEYIADATRPHNKDITNGTSNWTAGYGYQFWMNALGGYRGDGAFGQAVMVFPESNSVLAVFCEAPDMPCEIAHAVEFVRNYKPDDSRLAEAEELTEKLYTPETGDTPYEMSLKMEKNLCNLRSLRLVPDGDALKAELYCDHGCQTIVCGSGKYIENRVELVNMLPCISAMHEEDRVDAIRVYAAYRVEGGKTVLTLRHADQPHNQEWVITAAGLSMSTPAGDMLVKEIKAVI